MSTALSFTCHPTVAERFPHHATGIVHVSSSDLPDVLEDWRAQLSLQAPHPAIADAITEWTTTYSRMGAKPKYVSSLQALWTRYEATGGLWKINPIVDFYNWLSLVHGAPMASYDVRFLSGTLELVYSAREYASLPFVPLGEPKVTQHLKTGEVAYVDADKVVCRYWNWRDCDVSKLRDDSRDVLFVIDCVATGGDSLNEDAWSELLDDFSAHLGSSVCGAALVVHDRDAGEVFDV